MTPLECFHVEAAERLERLTSGLVALEQSTGDSALIGDLFREAHSLKGAAGVSGMFDVSEVCHKMEDILVRVRDGVETPGAAMIDALLHAADAVQRMVDASVRGVPSEVVLADVFDALTAWRSKAAGSKPVPRETRAPETERIAEPPPSSRAPSTTVRMHVETLEHLSNRTGELLVAGDRLRQRLASLRDLLAQIRSELVRHHGDDRFQRQIQPVAAKVRRVADEFIADTSFLDPLITDIHESVLEARMLPLRTLFDQLPRFVRDFCRRGGTQVSLVIEGAQARVDRRVLEKLRGPMIHLIRNALSHGVEPPGERASAGKDPVGVIRLSTSQKNDRIRITCEDDGRGIDRDRVLARAIDAELITESDAQELRPEEIDQLVLQPGFSTASTVTDVSGRGMGLDIALRRIEELRGTIGIRSEPGRFARFELEFPASIATLDGLLVEDLGQTYVIPTVAVARTEHLDGSRILGGVGGETLLLHDGTGVPLLTLAQLLGREGTATAAPPERVLVVRHRDQDVAIALDRFLGTQTVVRKSLGDHIGSIRGVVGATVLGSGRPALILEPAQLLDEGPVKGSHRALRPEPEDVADPRSPILVVDDSITTRIMEQSILESAGYAVETAVSAEDALEKIDARDFQLLVVDVEMPGMDGFELTRRLRADVRFAETPIVIVSSLGSEEHRREGLESGASAYIAKSDFDQTGLVRTVGRLIDR